jgi:serine/threonine protein phosphatase PrpC
VADGVGGWREHGIDPSLFSSSLMEACRSLIDNKLIDLNPLTLKELLSKGYQQLLEDKQCIIGERERSVRCSSQSDPCLSCRKQYGMYGGLAQRKEHSAHSKSG